MITAILNIVNNLITFAGVGLQQVQNSLMGYRSDTQYTQGKELTEYQMGLEAIKLQKAKQMQEALIIIAIIIAVIALIYIKKK